MEFCFESCCLSLLVHFLCQEKGIIYHVLLCCRHIDCRNLLEWVQVMVLVRNMKLYSKCFMETQPPPLALVFPSLWDAMLIRPETGQLLKICGEKGEKGETKM